LSQVVAGKHVPLRTSDRSDEHLVRVQDTPNVEGPRKIWDKTALPVFVCAQGVPNLRDLPSAAVPQAELRLQIIRRCDVLRHGKPSEFAEDVLLGEADSELGVVGNEA